MNWRRGLLRLWLVLSLCWIAGVGLYAWKQEPWILSSSQEFVFEGTPDSARDQQNESVEKIINSLSAETAKRYAASAGHPRARVAQRVDCVQLRAQGRRR
jgi:hypothetical protein